MKKIIHIQIELEVDSVKSSILKSADIDDVEYERIVDALRNIYITMSACESTGEVEAYNLNQALKAKLKKEEIEDLKNKKGARP